MPGCMNGGGGPGMPGGGGGNIPGGGGGAGMGGIPGGGPEKSGDKINKCLTLGSMTQSLMC